MRATAKEKLWCSALCTNVSLTTVVYVKFPVLKTHLDGGVDGIDEGDGGEALLRAHRLHIVLAVALQQLLLLRRAHRSTR
jgi:hypothetical protein